MWICLLVVFDINACTQFIYRIGTNVRVAAPISTCVAEWILYGQFAMWLQPFDSRWSVSLQQLMWWQRWDSRMVRVSVSCHACYPFYINFSIQRAFQSKVLIFTIHSKIHSCSHSQQFDHLLGDNYNIQTDTLWNPEIISYVMVNLGWNLSNVMPFNFSNIEHCFPV